jgi:glyoxylase I family protein
MNLGHIAISVSNIKRSTAFYSKFFNLRLAETYAFKDKGMKMAMLRGSFTLELFEFANRKPLPSYRKALGTDLQTLGVKHFSVETKDIVGAYKKFKSARVKFATPMSTFANGARYFFVKDPDGILVEIMELK